MVKAALERGLVGRAERASGPMRRATRTRRRIRTHVGGTSRKTTSTEVGDVDLDVPRDRAGTLYRDAGAQRCSAVGTGWTG
ncbi:transposase [Actinomyces oricola]